MKRCVAALLLVQCVWLDAFPVCDMLHSRDYTDGEWRPLREGEQSWHECPQAAAMWLNVSMRRCEQFGHGSPRALRWQPRKCDLVDFDNEQFWHKLSNHAVTFVGDSLSTQSYHSFACALDDGDDDLKFRPLFTTIRKKRFRGQLDHRIAPFFFDCIGCVPHTLRHLEQHAVGANTDAFLLFPKPKDNVLRWFEASYTARILVVNFGAWFSDHMMRRFGFAQRDVPGFADKLFIDALDFFFNTTLPAFNGTVVFRSISPAHDDCVGASLDAARQVEFNWRTFAARNDEIQRRIDAAQRPNLYFFDIFPMTLQRPDAHPGTYFKTISNDIERPFVGDCMHLCFGSTSVLNDWTRALFTMLMQILDNENDNKTTQR